VTDEHEVPLDRLERAGEVVGVVLDAAQGVGDGKDGKPVGEQQVDDAVPARRFRERPVHEHDRRPVRCGSDAHGCLLEVVDDASKRRA